MLLMEKRYRESLFFNLGKVEHQGTLENIREHQGTLGNIRRDWCSEGRSRPLIEDLKSDCRTLPAVPRDNALLMIQSLEVNSLEINSHEINSHEINFPEINSNFLKINSYLFKSNQRVSDNYVKSVTNVHIQSLITKSCVIFHCFYVVIQSFSLECHPSTWLLVRGPLKLKQFHW